MSFPIWGALVIGTFAVLLALTLALRPPNTARGRLWYAVTGACGLSAGGLLLSFAYFLASGGAVIRKGIPPDPWPVIAGRMMGLEGPSALSWSVGGAAAFAAGLGLCARAAFGAPPDEGPGHRGP
jgi:hypothetical protein